MTTPPEAPLPARPADLRMARLHLRLGSLELARAELEAFAGAGALDSAALLDLAEVRWRTGDVSGAGVAAQAYLGEGGDEALALVIAAEASAAAGRPTEARRLAMQVLERAEVPLEGLFAGIPRSGIWPIEPDERPEPAGELFEIAPTRPATLTHQAPGDDLAPEDGSLHAPTAAVTSSLWQDAAESDDADKAEEADKAEGAEQGRPSVLTLEPAAQVGNAADGAGLTDARGAGPAGIGLAAAAGLAATGGMVGLGPGPLAPPLLAPDPATELEVARADLAAGRRGSAATRIAIVLRLAPSLAADVLDLLADVPRPIDPAGASLELVRGDAYRQVGRDADARRSYAAAAAVMSPAPPSDG